MNRILRICKRRFTQTLEVRSAVLGDFTSRGVAATYTLCLGCGWWLYFISACLMVWVTSSTVSPESAKMNALRKRKQNYLIVYLGWAWKQPFLNESRL